MQSEKTHFSDCTSLRTYKPAVLNFEVPVEEENVMEWINLDPSIHQCIDGCECNSTEKNSNKEKSNQNAKINQLRKANVNLRQKIKRLESRIQKMAKTCKCKNKQKTNVRVKTSKKELKKRVLLKQVALKKLVNKQELHPVAKTMIHLQLHQPRTQFTEEEKMLSKQLLFSISILPFKESRL